MTSSLPALAAAETPLPVEVYVLTEDSGIHVKRVPRSNVFDLEGESAGSSTLKLIFDGRELCLPLAAGMVPTDIFELIESTLPSDLEAIARAFPGAGPLGSLTIQLVRRQHPESSVPQVRIIEASDRKQRVCFLGNNRLMIAGTALGSPPARLELEIDGRRLTLAVKKGDSARRTGKSLSTALPPGYRAILETRESDVALTVYRHPR